MTIDVLALLWNFCFEIFHDEDLWTYCTLMEETPFHHLDSLTCQSLNKIVQTIGVKDCEGSETHLKIPDAFPFALLYHKQES